MSQQNMTGARGRRVVGLVRHGHFDRPKNTASAHRILPLSPAGREQARNGVDAIAALCENESLELDTTIEVSQLLRAWQTGAILAETLFERTGKTFSVEEHDEIIERGLGSCANLRFDEIEATLALDPRLAPLPVGWRRIPDFCLPVQGAESLMQAGTRTAAYIEASMASIPEDDSRDLLRLFVAHSGCLRHAAVALGVVPKSEVSQLSMDFCQTILLEDSPAIGWNHLAGQWKKHLPAS
jgi:2,3-bisphosphoglycerate-dependent phosphoglycerate mutase